MGGRGSLELRVGLWRLVRFVLKGRGPGCLRARSTGEKDVHGQGKPIAEIRGSLTTRGVTGWT